MVLFKQGITQVAKTDIAKSVAQALVDMGVEHVVVDNTRRHPRVLWEDLGGTIRGIVTVPGSAGDRRSLINNIKMAQRLVRQARQEA